MTTAKVLVSISCQLMVQFVQLKIWRKCSAYLNMAIRACVASMQIQVTGKHDRKVSQSSYPYKPIYLIKNTVDTFLICCAQGKILLIVDCAA